MNLAIRSMTLGKRIALGFAAVIAITLILGGVCVVTMSSVTTTAKRLSEQYAPEVEFSSELGTDTQNAMLAMRSFAYTGQDEFFKQAQQELQLIDASLEKGRQLVKQYPQLETLRQQLARYEVVLKQYKDLSATTKTQSDALEQARQTMDAQANTFVTSIESFQNSQNDKLKEEIASKATADALSERASKVDTTAEIRNLVNQVRIAAFKAQATRDPQQLESRVKNFGLVQTMIKDMIPKVHQATNLAQLQAMANAVTAYETSTSELLKHWKDLEATTVQRGTVSTELVSLTRAVVEAGVKHTVTLSREAATTLSTSSKITTAGSVAAAIVGVVLAFLITHRVTRSLRGIADTLADGAGQTSSAASQVSAASQSLAEGASEQAASLEETSASLEELSSMTKKNAENAKQANDLTHETRSAAAIGSQEVESMNQAMTDIKKSSDEIAKIIQTIDEIAFQTNILALNAAVEAARAGEAGMGFAVVADEVRSLAQRSAQAAKDTSQKIESAIARTEVGVDLSAKVAQRLKEIVTKVEQVDQIAAEVASASNEQSQGIAQVNIAVTQMDKVTQSNAANAEESASAATELNAQANSLKEVVEELLSLVGADRKPAPSHGHAHHHASPQTRSASSLPRSTDHAQISRPQTTAKSSKTLSHPGRTTSTAPAPASSGGNDGFESF